jgi:hypothetical protein
MKFTITGSAAPADFRARASRFLKTTVGGPSKEVTKLDRWLAPDRGFCLAETDDFRGIYEWATTYVGRTQEMAILCTLDRVFRL